jgi:hypothetical protein
MKTLSEYPKSFIVVQTVLEQQMGVRSAAVYVLEVISSRTLCHKTIEIKPEFNPTFNTYAVSAPSGYRIYRAWKDSVSVANECHID